MAKNWRTSGNCSTICSTGASRAWTSSCPMLACRCTCSLRPGLQQCRWPHPLSQGPAIVRKELNKLGRSHYGAGDCLLAPWGVVRGVHLGVRVVGHRCQHRSDRLLLVSPPRAQSSLFPPLCGTDEGCHGLPSRVQPEK